VRVCMEVGMSERAVRVVVKSVGSARDGAEPLKVVLRGDGAVAALKVAIRRDHPARPEPAEQRLVYAGRLLDDEVRLAELAGAAGLAEIVVHLVISPNASSTAKGADSVRATATTTASASGTGAVATEPARSATEAAESEALARPSRVHSVAQGGAPEPESQSSTSGTSGVAAPPAWAANATGNSAALPEAEPVAVDSFSPASWSYGYNAPHVPGYNYSSYYPMPPVPQGYFVPQGTPPRPEQDGNFSALYSQQMWQACMMQAYVDAQLQYAYAMNQFYAGTSAQDLINRGSQPAEVSLEERQETPGVVDRQNVQNPSSSGLRQRTAAGGARDNAGDAPRQDQRLAAREPRGNRPDAAAFAGAHAAANVGAQGGVRGFVVQLEFNWGLMLKLAFLVFLLAQEGSPIRVAGLAFVAVFIYMWQVGRLDFVNRAFARAAPALNRVPRAVARVNEPTPRNDVDVAGANRNVDATGLGRSDGAPPNGIPAFALAAAHFFHGFVLSLLPNWRPVVPQGPAAFADAPGGAMEQRPGGVVDNDG